MKYYLILMQCDDDKPEDWKVSTMFQDRSDAVKALNNAFGKQKEGVWSSTLNHHFRIAEIKTEI